MDENGGFASFFKKDLVIVIFVIVFFIVGGVSMLGIMAAVNKVTIADLFKGVQGTEEQATLYGYNDGLK